LTSVPLLVLASHADLAGLRELGAGAAQDVLVRPFGAEELSRRIARLPLREARNQTQPEPIPYGERAREVPIGIETAVLAGTAALTSLFDQIGCGAPPRIAPFRDTSASFVSGLAHAATSDAGLAAWLATVRDHHSPTFAHSLTVTANAVLFGLHLGMRRSDLERLSIAGLLHDIGKAVVPLGILDKPARLDPIEAEQIRRHPQIGRDLLLRSPDTVAPELVDVVLHHHEYLDGSGYPDGLRGRQISDVVRVLTIADIFTALVEDRAYKPGMSPGAAIAVLRDMAATGKLDPALVGRFVDMVEASPVTAAA
jgi:HD-GYP domain-containing protein (c-di-GMP phosphodiesterase class II)